MNILTIYSGESLGDLAEMSTPHSVTEVVYPFEHGVFFEQTIKQFVHFSASQAGMIACATFLKGIERYQKERHERVAWRHVEEFEAIYSLDKLSLVLGVDAPQPTQLFDIGRLCLETEQTDAGQHNPPAQLHAIADVIPFPTRDAQNYGGALAGH